MALYREIKRLSKAPVTIALWQYGENDGVRKSRERSCQRKGEYGDLECLHVGENYGIGRRLLDAHKGARVAHLFCAYQVSPVFRRLIRDAWRSGCKVLVYSEAPCEMCMGVKAWFKRLYYFSILPFKLGRVARFVDYFLCQSGEMGIGRLRRLGWRHNQIVPFGYASPSLVEGSAGKPFTGKTLHILHTGVEPPYRDVGTLRKAVDILTKRGIAVDFVRTGGSLPLYEVERLFRWADVFVACGINEPWGMRVNDAIHAGLPVIVSSGMGAKMIVEETGCGCVYEKGSCSALANALARFWDDVQFRSSCLRGVEVAQLRWTPSAKARELLTFLDADS